ncbi:cyclopropane-fatty-acyl-phospholipid synthase family protein [Brevundimonas sp.]|uniref:SAM-dependent methyltransferase n=1 Tax=Brevundimonas sp. TaxID=1871086 RepID=UPI0027300064|nr:class I SAM-dependent methyltransferase [Brevundimonas sp.]
MSFQRIAYEVREVCNAVELATLEAAVARTGLGQGATAIDIGTGNATVAIQLAQRFGLAVAAIELDPVMADLARSRIEAAGVENRVSLTVARAAEVLARKGPVDLIVALGTTDVSGEGRPTPEAGFIALRRSLKPGGWLLWGDVVWLAEPPAPLRQITEATNLYTDDDGWRAAAAAAGFEVIEGRVSPQDVFDTYSGDSIAAARAWLDANPEAPGAASIRLNADRVQAIMEFGRDYIGFGLYLLRNPD